MSKHAAVLIEEAPIAPWANRAFVTIKDASRICGVSPSTIYSAAKADKITLQRLSGRVVVTPAELKRYIAAATPWTPSPNKANNTAEARAARSRASWAV